MKSRSSRARRRPERAHRWPAALAADVIADGVVREVSLFLRVRIPEERYVRWLTAKAAICFEGNRLFRRKLLGAQCRKYLRSFMRHWMAGLLKWERPDLWECLPPQFDLGHPLPDGHFPRINRRGGGPRRGALRWKAERIRSSPWRFLLAA